MNRYLLAALLASTLLGPAAGTVQAQELRIRGTIAPAAWKAFEDRFVDASGRVVDNANGGISHSEGQGYGLILSLAADDRAAFERIWSFTQTELMLRDDGLAAWSWRVKEPHVPDVNNATDGDLLIAYGLAKAGEAWNDDGYILAATRIAKAIGKEGLTEKGGLTLLLPGTEGFTAEARADGPVVNPSYWVFEALPVMARLVPDVDWTAIWKSGLWLAGAARFGRTELPTDWVSLHGDSPAPAAGFDPDFGYNSIRIPLYLIRGGISDPQWLGPYARNWANSASTGIPLVNVKTNQVVANLTDPGYRILAALVACVDAKTRIPDELKLFRPTQYYPAALYLLSFSYLAERHPECL
ncbi:endoglucanase [Kaistia algarum]|uniref:glycosyl hydrolase family 8 n=1 Tax=Kaistia algarum TaxID=2083279 RepID=UPI000CE7714D|nr:glycosyl hydrolase family 8 [Kaistia algarum]MCX5516162.1 glycosyl hydrolase family 8 [Kaistia algarum]PPE78236.1 endoglucanase [Kaistia algarum]